MSIVRFYWFGSLCSQACILSIILLFSESFAVDPEAEGGFRNIIDFFSVRHGIVPILHRLRMIVRRFFLCWNIRTFYDIIHPVRHRKSDRHRTKFGETE